MGTSSTQPAQGETDLEIAPHVQEAIDKVNQLNERAVALIRERPVACLIGAMTLGYVVGKIAARR